MTLIITGCVALILSAAAVQDATPPKQGTGGTQGVTKNKVKEQTQGVTKNKVKEQTQGVTKNKVKEQTQGVTKNTGKDQDPGKIEIQKPRPRKPIPNYRIQVRMKSGRRFKGVVSRNVQFQELVEGGAHLRKATYELADTFTMRYIDDLDGDMTLSWNQLRKLEVREILDWNGLKSYEHSYRRRRVADEADKRPSGESSNRTKKIESSKSKKDKAKDLLKEFDPADGWSPDRKEQIQFRQEEIGLEPDAQEARFIEVFDQWKPLYEEWLKENPPKAGDKKKAADS